MEVRNRKLYLVNKVIFQACSRSNIQLEAKIRLWAKLINEQNKLLVNLLFNLVYLFISVNENYPIKTFKFYDKFLND